MLKHVESWSGQNLWTSLAEFTTAEACTQGLKELDTLVLTELLPNCLKNSPSKNIYHQKN